MIRPIALIICACLFLASCGQGASDSRAPDYTPTASSAPAAQVPASSSRQLAPEPEPEPVETSFARSLAADILRGEILVNRETGEAAVRAIYRWLIQTVRFADPVGLDAWRYLSDETQTISYLENRALSPLLFQIGSCEDFAAAMTLLLREAGFESEYVAGYTLSVEQVYIDHAWAVIRLEDDWYHIDPQLEQNVTRNNTLTYRYYLRSDKEFELDHKWGESLIDYWPDMPEAEKQAIRELYTPPVCLSGYSRPKPAEIALPVRPDMSELESKIERIKRESGKGILHRVPLNVEPPILVSARHVTPPLPERCYITLRLDD